MEVLNALDLKSGKSDISYSKIGTLVQPYQMLPDEEKTQEWASWNIDWIELQGLKQINKKARRLLKNYKLAKGIIDKTDYIIEEENDFNEFVQTLLEDTDSNAMELKFYPLIPTFVNVLSNEFAKRNTKIIFKAIDEYTQNEILEKKKAEIEDVLLEEAAQKVLIEMLKAGYNPEDEEAKAQIEEALKPKNLKTLPEIQDFYGKNYRGIYEEWAMHQTKVDEERFSMDELEERAFRDMLITDSEFWHFRMYEDDYEIELLNPVLTFYHKSPRNRYVSNSNWAGFFDMMTLPDVINTFGWLMTEEQQKSLEAFYPVKSAGYAIGGIPNDGSFYDASKSHEWNVEGPSLAYRQFFSTSNVESIINNNVDIVGWILGESEDYGQFPGNYFLRVTTCYWQTLRKIGYLTKITDNHEIINEIVTEDYKIIDKPIYDTKIIKNKTKDNLIYGEHIDWLWIPEVWGGIKIGPNKPTFWGQKNPGGINPIYIGINQNKIGKLKFQFKGDNTEYGCKLPIEGAVFSDRNTRSMSMIDLLKPYQIGYNIVNNQIADILVDELGTVILLDHNAIPQHSMGEDWGKNNYANFYLAMKNFHIAPLDTTLANTENATAFNHYQMLNLEQTQRLLSRIQLANYFKQQALEVMGISPQRLAQQMGQIETAKGIEQAVTGSYNQTEHYFIQHSDYLMPRVHQMRTDLAQYYHSRKPSIRLTYITSNEEKITFQINGTELLLRDINVYCTSKANIRRMLEELKQLIMTNNTTGATIYELGKLLQDESIAEINKDLEKIQKRVQEEKEREYAEQEKRLQMEIEARQREKALEMDFKARQNELDRQKDIFVAEIRAAGLGSLMDINKNMQSDYQDYMDKLQKDEHFAKTMQIQSENNQIRREQFQQQQNMKEKELQTRIKLKEIDERIAKENKNRYDVKENKEKKKK